jgi:DNA adenine methylase
MRPFFCRQGSKRKYAKALLSLFPAHHTYVEPFLGGGAVFWAKEPSPKEIINDLDSDLIRDYRLLRNVPLTGSPFKLLTTEQQQNAFLRKTHRAKKDLLLEALLRRCNGYGGTYIEKGTKTGVYTDDRKGRVHKVTTHEDKLSNITEYRTRIRNATLLNESYDDVIRKYDGRRTFIFLDPPYEKSVGLDYAEGSDAFPFRQFADDLRKVKGKFLVTINDSPAIRDLFKGFKLYPYIVKGHHAKSAIGKEDRKELLITNYPLARDWKSRMTKGTLKGGAYECEDDDEMEGSGTHREDVLEELNLPDVGHSLADLAKASGVPLSTLQEVYNRGIGAYKTNPESVRMKGSFKKNVSAPMSQKLPKEQWAMARVYSFLDENPKHDQDLRGEGLFARVREVLASKFGREPTPLMTLQQTIRPVFAASAVVTPIPPDLRPYARVKADGGTCAVVALNNVFQRDIMNLSTIPRDRVVRTCGLTRVVSDYVADAADREALTKDGRLILNTIVERLRVFDSPSSKTHGTTLGSVRTFLEWTGMTVKEVLVSPETLEDLYTLFANTNGPFAALFDVIVGGERHMATIRKFLDAEGGTVLYWFDDLAKFSREDNRPVAWRVPFTGDLLRRLQFLYDDPPLVAVKGVTLVTAPTVVENPLRGEGKSLDHFLGTVGYSPMTYIRDVRRKAKKAGYNPDDVGFAKDGTHKLMIHTPDGRTVKFGRVGYGDHLLWTHMEKRGKAPPGTSTMKRRVFRKSHSAIRGNWRSDKFSPNNLALAILW